MDPAYLLHMKSHLYYKYVYRLIREACIFDYLLGAELIMYHIAKLHTMPYILNKYHDFVDN